MKVAGIDIGTNSMRLLLADINSDGSFIEEKSRQKEVRITRMGKGVNETKLIDEEIFKKNIESFRYFVDKAKQNEAKHIFAIGTSALRDAQNAHLFVKEAREHTGIKIDVIDGECEAMLGFYGVSQGLGEKGRLLIIDIGGGSTEFIIGSIIEGIIFKKSIDIGAVRLTEKFGENIDAMELFIEEQILYLKNIIEKYKVKLIVGIGGTITTASSINQTMEVYDSNKIHNSELTSKDVFCIQSMLKSLNLEERKRVIGLQVERADIILAGITILKKIMNIFKIERIKVSEYDNLEGMIYHYLKDI